MTSSSSQPARHAAAAIAAAGVASFAWCHGYAVLEGRDADALRSLGWALADWAVWLALAPWLATRLAVAGPAHAWRHALVAVALALAVRGLLDGLAGEWTMGLLLYKRLPVYLGVAAAIAALAWWQRRPAPAVMRVPDATLPEPTLALQSARGEHVLPASAVSAIEACGNYLEVRAGGATYLMRATMKSLEESLAGSVLVRCHRSFFVNLTRVTKLEYRDSGNHVLKLVDGGQVPVSKAYRDAVRDALARTGGCPAAAG